MKKILAIFVIIISIVFCNVVMAKVTGPCANCHTMHNSQAGSSTTGGDPQATLLINSCVGCHTGINSSGTSSSAGSIPYVYSTTEPTFEENTLAGGNFYWVENVDDSRGHNVFITNPDSVSPAPGTYVTCTGGADCHISLATISDSWYPGQRGRQGCTKCHMVSDSAGPKGYHHSDDSEIIIDKFPFYRFLGGEHMTGGALRGVYGVEDNSWNFNATPTKHNEYLGKAGNHLDAWYFLDGANTITAYCCGCHGLFHKEQNAGGEWIKHPADTIIPDEGEYADAFGANGSGLGVYDPNIPIARPNLSSIGDTSQVRIGTDLVFCLSCHVAHGSPYKDLLRWDYTEMVAGGDENVTGCFACHTKKDTGD